MEKYYREPNNIEAVKFSLDKAIQRIAQLEATRVPDELLEVCIFALREQNLTGSQFLAQAILNKRKEGE